MTSIIQPAGNNISLKTGDKIQVEKLAGEAAKL